MKTKTTQPELKALVPSSSFPPGGAKSNGIANNKKAQVQIVGKNSAGSPKAPPAKCHICGNTEFWLRDSYGPPEWLCTRCHPCPKGLEVVVSGGKDG